MIGAKLTLSKLNKAIQNVISSNYITFIRANHDSNGTFFFFFLSFLFSGTILVVCSRQLVTFHHGKGNILQEICIFVSCADKKTYSLRNSSFWHNFSSQPFLLLTYLYCNLKFIKLVSKCILFLHFRPNSSTWIGSKSIVCIFSYFIVVQQLCFSVNFLSQHMALFQDAILS